MVRTSSSSSTRRMVSFMAWRVAAGAATGLVSWITGAGGKQEVDGKGGAAATKPAVDKDVAAGELDDILDNGQAKAGALAGSLVVKNGSKMRANTPVHAAAGVFNL